MKKVQTHRLITASALAAALAAAGCGGGGSGGGTSPTTATISGAVADGYLQGAKVCLDKNRNAKCDAGEASDTSKADGSYSLTVESGDAAKYPVVAEVGAATIDADTGAAVAKAYVLMAPPGAQASSGKVYVTPMTTLVQSAMLEAPSLTPTEAEAAVKVQMGYAPTKAISLFEDYVARKATNTDYRDIHQVAQVVARVLGENKAAIETAATQAGLTPANLSKEIAHQVGKAAADQMQQIVTIASDAANFTNGVIKSDNATQTAIAAAKTTYDAAGAQAAIANAQSMATATKSNIVTVFQSGPKYFQINQQGNNTFNFWRGTDQLNTAATQMNFSEEKYSAASSSWNAAAMSGKVELVNGSWQQAPDNVMNFAAQADGSANFSAVGGIQSGNVRVSEMDVSGRAVADFFHSTRHAALKAGAKFSAGAKAYIITVVQNADYYKIGQWTNCGGSPTINGSCNAVARLDQSGQQVTNYLTTLVELLQVTDRGLIGIGDGGNRLTVVFGGGGSGAAGESGTATFYTAPQGQNIDSSTTPAAGTGTWKIVNVGGQLLLEVENVPPALQGLATNDWGDTLFFAVHDGAVRRGSFKHKGVPSTGDVDFNSVASQDVLNALDLSKSVQPAP